MRRNLIRWIWGMAVLAAMSFSCTKPVVIVPPEPEDEQRIWEVEVRQLDSSCDGQKIFGQLHFPKGRKGKVPLLICSHGLSGPCSNRTINTLSSTGNGSCSGWMNS